MPVRLEEFKRSVQLQDPTLAGVVTVFQENAPILGEGRNLGYPLPALGFDNSPGGHVSYTRQKTLPGVKFRKVNEKVDATQGETEKVFEEFGLITSKVTYDRAAVNRYGENALIQQQIMHISAIARKWNHQFYKGTKVADESFSGLDKRISGEQLIDNGGGALDFVNLDEALLTLTGDNRLIVMGRKMLSRITRAAKFSVNVNYTPQTFGVSPATYDGVPIMLAGEDAAGDDVLGFDEDDDTTSIYLLSLGDNGVVGAQTKPIATYPLDAGNQIDSSFEFEWDSSFVIKNPRSAIRIKGIANEAITPAALFFGQAGVGTGTGTTPP